MPASQRNPNAFHHNAFTNVNIYDENRLSSTEYDDYDTPLAFLPNLSYQPKNIVLFYTHAGSLLLFF